MALRVLMEVVLAMVMLVALTYTMFSFGMPWLIALLFSMAAVAFGMAAFMD